MSEGVWEVERICWLDVETTGLDPDKGLLLEVAVVVTDRWLRELARNSVVIGHSPAAIEASEMGDYVRDMHTENGLLDYVTGRGQFIPRELDDAEHSLVVTVNRGCEEHTVFLGGSSPGGVDRPFLKKYMPKLYARLYHRSIDATCLNLAYTAWGGGQPPKRSTRPHRALEDTLASIQLAKRVMRVMYRGAKLIAREDGAPFEEVFFRPKRKENGHVRLVQTSSSSGSEEELGAVCSVPS